ncbi:MAG: hypothetical protein QF473_13140 [Planctomycetota bacterium]|nr:hypothetical protein [Planctomycetota bacterium]
MSRKFLYEQAKRAETALDVAFAPEKEDDQVLFYLPVTRTWIKQVVLALVLICHSSFRGAVEFLEAVMGFSLSVGSVFNIVNGAAGRAREVNLSEDLSPIRVGAHDEIYQKRRPVLVGADVKSTYCYLLKAEDHCDETTWGIHLLDVAERGLHPERTIADGGRGQRAGQAAAWESIPCQSDVFHAVYELGKLVTYLKNRASTCATACQKLERKMAKARKRCQGRSLSKNLAGARRQEADTSYLAENVATLADWMREDILAAAGPCFQTRQELFDFVIEELRALEPRCAYRIGPVGRMLENQRDDLLLFAAVLDEKLENISTELDVPLYHVRALCELQSLDKNQPAYWQREAPWRKTLGYKFHALEQAVIEALADTPRASSIVENLNGRLRNYFFLRRHIGNDYLELLRFFLNHRRFIRSEHAYRAGKSPAEILSGKSLPHWLELLGFQRFHAN